MLLHALNRDCLEYVLSLLDTASVTVLEHVPELVPTDLLSQHTGSTDIVTDSIKQGYNTLVRWCVDLGYPISKHTTLEASRVGDLGILQYLSGMGCEIHKDACGVAAEGHHHTVLTWLLEMGCRWDEATEEAVASSGDLSMLKVLHSYVGQCTEEPDVGDLSFHVAEKGHIHILEYYLSNADLSDCIPDMFCGAAHGGQTETITWLVEQGHTPPDDITDHAAFGGQVGMLEWLVENEYGELSHHTYDRAARGGHVHVLVLLKERGVLPNLSFCIEAVLQNQLDVLKWVRDNHYQLDVDLLSRYPTNSAVLEFLNECSY